MSQESIEIWGGTRKVTFYPVDGGVLAWAEFVKVDGTNIHTDMVDGAVKTVEELLDVLRWVGHVTNDETVVE